MVVYVKQTDNETNKYGDLDLKHAIIKRVSEVDGIIVILMIKWKMGKVLAQLRSLPHFVESILVCLASFAPIVTGKRVSICGRTSTFRLLQQISQYQPCLLVEAEQRRR